MKIFQTSSTQSSLDQLINQLNTIDSARKPLDLNLLIQIQFIDLITVISLTNLYKELHGTLCLQTNHMLTHFNILVPMQMKDANLLKMAIQILQTTQMYMIQRKDTNVNNLRCASFCATQLSFPIQSFRRLTLERQVGPMILLKI